MKDLDWDLFDRYLANAATPAEREQFERWLSERPERAGLVTAWHRALEKMEGGMAAADRQAVWAGALEGVDVPARVHPGNAGGRGRRAWRLGAGIAAAAVITTGAVVAARTLIQNSPSAEQAERVVSVARGQRGQLRLPDGTSVILAAGSVLRHPAEFSGSSREVRLEGEAYFVVEHDARRPFRVRAGDLVATDLGTEFLVRAYPEDPGAKVVVRSGEVAVQASAGIDGRPQQIVNPGQIGRLDAAGVPRVERADTAAYFGWTHGTLVFDGTPLREALPQLSRWYNLEFQLGDSSLASIPLSGRLDQTLTSGRLDLLAGSLGLQQVRRGNVVTFSRY